MKLGVLGGSVLLVAILPVAVAYQQATTLLDRHDFGRRSARFDLPGRLDEISGLAVTTDGRLFGHDDERAVVHEIDPVAGTVEKRFSLGDPPLRGDFEGIAVVGERFFMVTSGGLLYEFREADDRAEAPYRVTDTGLGEHCEVEGLDYDPIDEALLLACKVSARDGEAVLVHRLALDPAGPPLPPIRVPRSEIAMHDVDEGFEPSAIVVDPTGTLVMVSAPFESLIEFDRGGRVLSGTRLSRNRHPQPEGLAFGLDGTLYIADERNRRDARITAYARVSPEGRDP